MNLSTDDILIDTRGKEAARIVKGILDKFFDVKASFNLPEFAYLNQRIIQSVKYITIDKADYMIKMYKQYFKGHTPPKCDIPFQTDNIVENNFTAAILCSPEDLRKLEQQYGCKFCLLYGNLQHVQVQSRPNITYATYHLGIF